VKPLAILIDSFRETLDRKSFLVMSGLAGLLIVFFAGISFRKLDEKEAMTAVLANFNLVFRIQDGVWSRRYDRAGFEISDFRAGDGYAFTLKGSPPDEVHRLVRHWDAIRTGKCRAESDPVPEADAPTDALLQKRFLEIRFRQEGIPDVEAEPAGPLQWTVRVHASGTRTIAGAEEMSLLYGLTSWRPRLPGVVPSARRHLSSAEVVMFAELLLAEGLMGLVGILIAIVVTAGSVPRMLQKGTLDLLLSRPIERPLLLGETYLGGCLQVLLGSALLIGGCWLALSWRTGHWNLGFPATILTLTFSFMVLHSVSVLAGVFTRSWAASALSTLVAWLAFYGVGKLRQHFASAEGLGAPAPLVAAVRFVHLLLPKPADLSLANQSWIIQGQMSAAGAPGPEWPATIPLATILFTGALFALLMISLASTRFSKQDY